MEKSYYKEALASAESDNLLGVANSFVYTLRALHEEQSRENHHTDWIKSHPLVRLYTKRLLELTGEPSKADRDFIHKTAGN